MRKQTKWILRCLILVVIIGVFYFVHSFMLPGQVITKNTDKVGNNRPFLPKIGTKLTLNTVKQTGNEFLIKYKDSKWTTLTKGEPFPKYNSKNQLIEVIYSSSIDHSYMVRTVNTLKHTKWLNKDKTVLQSYNYVIYIKQNQSKK